jgi:hypothetical protein
MSCFCSQTRLSHSPYNPFMPAKFPLLHSMFLFLSLQPMIRRVDTRDYGFKLLSIRPSIQHSRYLSLKVQRHSHMSVPECHLHRLMPPCPGKLQNHCLWYVLYHTSIALLLEDLKRNSMSVMSSAAAKVDCLTGCVSSAPKRHFLTSHVWTDDH